MFYNWDEHRDLIGALYIQENFILKQLLEELRNVMHLLLSTYIQSHSMVPILRIRNNSMTALKKKIKLWGFGKNPPSVQPNLQLQGRINDLWRTTSTDAELLQSLAAEGYIITKRQLKNFRLKLRLR